MLTVGAAHATAPTRGDAVRLLHRKRVVERSPPTVQCPLEYKSLVGCGSVFAISSLTDNGLVRCPECGLWFRPDLPEGVAERVAQW